jgi:membrane peptidoglycan carboxypeptidase
MKKFLGFVAFLLVSATIAGAVAAVALPDETQQVANDALRWAATTFRHTDEVAILDLSEFPQESLLCTGETPIEECTSATAAVHYTGGYDRIELTVEQLKACGAFFDEAGNLGSNPLFTALVLEEDRNQLKHAGFDLWRALGALWSNLLGALDERNTQGASTIEGQTVGLDSGIDSPTVMDKVREGLDAVNLKTYVQEQGMDPATIPATYMALVHGGRGTYGVGSTLATFYGLNLAAGDCPTAAQAAMWAVSLSNPSLHDPWDNPDYALRQRNRLLATMAEGGFLTQAEYDEAVGTAIADMVLEQPLDSTGFTREPALPGGLTYLAEAAKRIAGQVLASPELQANPTLWEDAKLMVAEPIPGGQDQLFEPGGVAIAMTIMPQLQVALEQAIYGEGTPLDTSGNLRSSGVLIDNATGRVAAMTNNLDWNNNQILLALDPTQTGSTFKPFTLIAALEAGIDPHTSCQTAASSTVEVPFTDPGTGKEFTIHGGRGGSPNLITGMKVSDNVCYMDVAVNLLGNCSLAVEEAKQLGAATEMSGEHCSSVLGAQEITPLDLATAFSTIASGGIYHQPQLVTAIRTRDGSIIQNPPLSERRLDESVAATVTSILRLVVQDGTGKYVGANVNYDVAGKTGTTNDGTAWFVGYTTDYSLVINVVNLQGEGVSVGGGGGVPAQLWVRAMNAVVDITSQPGQLPTLDLNQ